tara:strand:- start:222 stop:524 length:303 start_codon:yes stop_codon:yes gene_type:complete
MNRYKTIELNLNREGVRYKRNSIFPELPDSADDLYIIATSGDRYDTLANTYYQDPSLWWVIAGANNSKKDSLVVDPGVQLRIPSDVQGVIEAYNDLNNNR